LKSTSRSTTTTWTTTWTTGGGLTSFDCSQVNSTPTFVCSSPINSTRWHNGAASEPALGDICYTDSGGGTRLPTGYYKITDGSRNGAYIQIGSSFSLGYVIDINGC